MNKIVKVDDTEEMRALHKLAFAEDPWPGDDHEFWVAYDEHGAVVGFCSAVLLTADSAFLSRAAVARSARRSKLHRRLIRERLKWMSKMNVEIVVTYVDRFNYASMINLLREGFRFAPNSFLRGWREYHLMYLMPRGELPMGQLKVALSAMADVNG